MGSVWEGWDEVLQRPVAVKLLHQQPGLSPDEAERANSRALREARITARLHHPNAVPVYDVVDENGQPCLIMQFLPSTSLQELVREKGALPHADVARIGADIAAALAAAHEAGIVHRDVKPGNVLIAEDGTAKLTDFGIAHAFGDVTLTSTGMLTGTPAYLAPEVARGELSSYPSDVFSLGATLYTALEGLPPFGTEENPIALLHRVAGGRITPPSQRGPLVPLLMRMMSADPASRPAARDIAREMAETLQALSRSDSTTVLQPRLPPRQPAATMPFAAPPPRQRDTGYRDRPPGVPVAVAAAGREASGAAVPPDLRPRPSAPARSPEPRRGFPWIPVLAVGLLLGLGLVLLVVLLQNGGGGGGATTTTTRNSASHTASHSRTHSASKSAAKHSSTRSASRSAASSSSTRPSSTASASSAPVSSSARSSAGGGGSTPSASNLAQAISSYYGLLPANTDAAWQHLTPSYQSGHAGGRSSYDSFWGEMKQVTVSNVSGSPPGAAQATVTYYYNDGRVVDEDTEFGLVRQAGILKIDSSTVLSSRRR
jgi:serine/threonine protein kinase